MPRKEPLTIKETILKKLIVLIKTPLLQYMDILSNILKRLKMSCFDSSNGKKPVYLINVVERFKHIFHKISRSILCCSNIGGINMIYNELIEFLNQFDSFDDQLLLVFFQPLIVKFNYFHDFFQSFRVINDIYEKISNDAIHWDLKLQKEIQWYITFHEDLLQKLTAETKSFTNQLQKPLAADSKPKFYRQNCYIKDV